MIGHVVPLQQSKRHMQLKMHIVCLKSLRSSRSRLAKKVCTLNSLKSLILFNHGIANSMGQNQIMHLTIRNIIKGNWSNWVNIYISENPARAPWNQSCSMKFPPGPFLRGEISISSFGGFLHIVLHSQQLFLWEAREELWDISSVALWASVFFHIVKPSIVWLPVE